MSATSVFKRAPGTTADAAALSPLGQSVLAMNASLSNQLGNRGGDTFVSAGATNLVAGLESLSETDKVQGHSDLHAALESMASTFTTLGAGTNADAGRYALGLTGAAGAYMAGGAARDAAAAKAGAIAATSGVPRIREALEAYDNSEVRRTSIFTVSYNLHAARQDAFGEAWYPTVVVPPDEVGWNIQIQLLTIHDEQRRNGAGNPEDWNVHNLVHGYRRPELLFSDSTTIHAVYRESGEHATAKYLVDKALVTPLNITPYDETFATQPYATGAQFSLISVSQTDGQLAKNHRDTSDALDVDMNVKRVFLQVGNDVVSFNTSGMFSSNFTYSVQGDTQRLSLNYNASIKLTAATTQHNATPLATLKAIADNDLEVQVEFDMFGSFMRDYGNGSVNASNLRVARILNQDGTKVALDDAAVEALVQALEGGKVIGYELNARLVNTNRRTLGKLLRSRVENQLYTLPLMTTLAIQRPQGLSDSTDASDVAQLITATRVATSGAAVNALLQSAAVLREAASTRADIGQSVRVLGPASQLLSKYFYKKIKIEVDQTLNLQNSYDLAKNIQATLVNASREAIYDAYQSTGLKAAYEVLYGAQAQMPKVLFGTDQKLHKYLMIEGDLRTIGGGFDEYEVVESMNEKMDGKMFITLVPRNMPEGAPHPLAYGWMGWKPEVVTILPIQRNGGNNKELIVQPSFRHVTNLPILIEVEITGIPESTRTRVPVNANIIGDVNLVAPTTPVVPGP